MTDYKLREYQEKAIWDTFKFIKEGKGNPVIAAPTGVGKAGVIAGLIKTILFKNGRVRILVLSHVKELVQQDHDELLKLWKTAPSAIYSAGLGRKEVGQVTFAGIGSVVNKAELFSKVDLIIIDECHRSDAKETSDYVRFVNAVKSTNENLKVIGLSATCYRLGHGLITENHPIFTGFSIDLTSFEWFNWFIDEGYLAKLTTKKTDTILDVSNVKITAGDYNQKDLAIAVDKLEVTREALKEAVYYGQDRKAWICFATSIDHCIHIADMLNNEFGIPTIAIHSKMTSIERDDAISDFKKGVYRCAVNMMVLSTGTNIPHLDMLIDLAPTTSTSRYIQRYGRLTRPVYAQGFDLSTREGRLAAIDAGCKSRGALCLDFAGTVSRLGCINDPIIPKRKKDGTGGGTPPIKTCPECGTINHPTVRYCPDCGYEFVFEVKITHKASTKEVVASAPRTKVVYNGEDTWFDVYDVTYAKHFSKASGKYSLKITYQCGYSSYSEYKSFEGRAYGATVSWWYKRCNGYVPKSLDEAMQYVAQLAKPTKVLVGRNGKFDNIKNYELPEEKPYIEEVVNVIN